MKHRVGQRESKHPVRSVASDETPGGSLERLQHGKVRLEQREVAQLDADSCFA